MYQKIIIAIDPGAKGAIAVYYPDYQRVIVESANSEVVMAQFIRDLAIRAEADHYSVVAYVEKVGGFIKGNAAPGSAMFNFGRITGVAVGALLARDISLVEVRPQDWQKGYVPAKLKGPERKRALKDAAQKLYPKLKCTLLNADALLILDYARRMEGKM